MFKSMAMAVCWYTNPFREEYKTMCMQDIAIALHSEVIISPGVKLQGTDYNVIKANPNRIAVCAYYAEIVPTQIFARYPGNGEFYCLNTGTGSMYGEFMHISKYGKIVMEELYYFDAGDTSIFIETVMPQDVMKMAYNMFRG